MIYKREGSVGPNWIARLCKKGTGCVSTRQWQDTWLVYEIGRHMGTTISAFACILSSAFEVGRLWKSPETVQRLSVLCGSNKLLSRDEDAVVYAQEA